MSYAEMSCRIPSAGSSYAYVYFALGELPAVIAAWFLTLEYGISGAAIARSWGDKFVILLDCCYLNATLILNPGYGVNVLAGLMQFGVMLILLGGVSIGKITVNAFTVLKMVVIMLMIIVGLSLFKSENVANWAPYGSAGILRGSTSAFFGYLGYDGKLFVWLLNCFDW